MGKVKRKLKEARARVHAPIINAFSSKLQLIGQRLRIRQRIRLLNIRAIRNPRKYMLGYIGILAFIFITGVLQTAFTTGNTAPDMQGITMIDPIFEGFREINNIKEQQKKEMSNIAKICGQLKHEVDSIYAIENKTKEDSLELFHKSKQLNIIINNLSPQNDKN